MRFQIEETLPTERPPPPPYVRPLIPPNRLPTSRIRTVPGPLGQSCARGSPFFEWNLQHGLPQAPKDDAAVLRGRLRAGDCGGERLGGPGARERSAEMERNYTPGVFA